MSAAFRHHKQQQLQQRSYDRTYRMNQRGMMDCDSASEGSCSGGISSHSVTLSSELNPSTSALVPLNDLYPVGTQVKKVGWM
jgi:hypothetical protein